MLNKINVLWNSRGMGKRRNGSETIQSQRMRQQERKRIESWEELNENERTGNGEMENRNRKMNIRMR